MRCTSFLLPFLLTLAPALAAAQESPYFATTTHEMEEPGTLEVSLKPVFGVPRAGSAFVASWTELEYGLKDWWTTELYLDGQHTWGQSSVFTGFRWENRFRLLRAEHRVNPVLYLEYENVNGADKTFQEVVGFDSALANAAPNSETRQEVEREIETKLILSSEVGGWNVAENFIAEKNLIAAEAWEFGYALGASRALAHGASPAACTLCARRFTAGLELFGGLGTRHNFTLRGTSHYLAPALAWRLNSATLRFSPAFGLTRQSHRLLIRVGISYEFPHFGRRLRSLLR